MKIAITGSTGLVGSALTGELQKHGHSIYPLVRSPNKISALSNAILWDYEQQKIEKEKLENMDAVVHLAGVNLASRRWTPAFKRVLYESRVQGTKFLSDTLASLKSKPKVLFSASAVGYYGSHEASQILTETSLGGSDFLATLCQDWEKATARCESSGIRVIHMRLGAVLSKKGGALGKMLPIFRLGLGGKIGSGQQMMSWIAVTEIPRIIQFLMNKDNIRGPVNFVSLQPVPNAEFTEILGKVLKRPAICPVPGVALKLLLGEMADAILLGGAKVLPKKLSDAGYSSAYPELKSALENVLY